MRVDRARSMAWFPDLGERRVQHDFRQRPRARGSGPRSADLMELENWNQGLRKLHLV